MKLLARLLQWTVFWVIAAVLVSFAVSNDRSVDLFLWPLPGSLNASVLVLSAALFFLGFFIGVAVLAWSRLLSGRAPPAATARDPFAGGAAIRPPPSPKGSRARKHVEVEERALEALPPA